ncbi:MAG TPA: T9SS type A sorting domain-containing protein, partial [Bacteroidia bacterium]|nr:T9SS type A sorting domain-containing protein [Bacteroidia bacterium]
TVTVNVYTPPAVIATASVDSFCSGTSTTLNAGGAASYSWSPGNMTGANITVSPSSSTNYIVTGTDTNGCTNADTVMLTVYPSPTLTVTSTNSVICTGGSTSLMASGATTYTWQPGNLTGATVTVTPATSTNYTVTGVDTNGCTGISVYGMSVAAPPNVYGYSSLSNACTNDPPILLTGIPAGGTWSGPGVAGNNFSPSVAGAGTHTLTYSYTDTYGCSNTATVTIVVDPCAGVHEQSALNGVSFYPNPNAGSFTLNVQSGDIHTLTMEIFDLQGRIVYSQQLDGISSGYSKDVDVSFLANGAYYLRFTSDSSSQTTRLIIEK